MIPPPTITTLACDGTAMEDEVMARYCWSLHNSDCNFRGTVRNRLNISGMRDSATDFGWIKRVSQSKTMAGVIISVKYSFFLSIWTENLCFLPNKAVERCLKAEFPTTLPVLILRAYQKKKKKKKKCCKC